MQIGSSGRSIDLRCVARLDALLRTVYDPGTMLEGADADVYCRAESDGNWLDRFRVGMTWLAASRRDDAADMILTSAHPFDIERWFHVQDERHELLCIPIGVDSTATATFAELVRRVSEADAALGERVAFLMFAQPNGPVLGFRGAESTGVIPANILTPHAAPDQRFRVAREVLEGVDQLDPSDGAYGDRIARLITERTRRFVPDLMV